MRSQLACWHLALQVQSRPDLWPASAGEGGGVACGALATFQRVAGLVQSRAFHMQEDNWVTGTSKVRGRWRGWCTAGPSTCRRTTGSLAPAR